MVRFDYLEMKNPQVQKFLWDWIDPSQIAFGMTKLDAMKELEMRFKVRQEALYGDLERGIALRCQYPRPDVVMPHVLGNASWIRSVIQVGSGVLFGMGMKWIHVWTQDERIARIVQAFGYSQQAALEGHGHVINDKEEATFILSMERSAYYRASNKLEVVNG